MACHSLLACCCGHFAEELDVLGGSTMALSVKSPSQRAHHIHIKLTESVLGVEEIVLVFLE